MKKIALLFLTIAGIACTSESLSVKQATSLIEEHTENHPYFEKSSFHLGERRLSIRKDAEEISILKQLQTESLININTIDKHKKLLSKDSVWVVNIGLTEKASDYVISQKKNRAEVKTYLFTIQEDSDVSLELNSKTKATAKVKLIKKATPFAGISKDKNPNSAFITRDFMLKYDKKTGWYVNSK